MSNQLSISRRKILAGLGTIGIASAGAGLGTTAYFRDEESVAAELEAGRLDVLVDYRATYRTWLDQAETEAIVDGPVYPVPDDDTNYVVGQAPDWRDATGGVLSGPAWASLTKGDDAVDACAFEDTTDIRSEVDANDDIAQAVDGTPVDPEDSFSPGYVDGAEGLLFDLTDVKPKDEGEATVSVHLCDNPAFLGLTAELVAEATGENTVYEPENVGTVDGADFADDEDASELPYYLYVRAWLDADCSNTYESGSETLVYQGSLAGLVAAISDSGADESPVDGLQVGDACLDPGVHCVAFDWYFVCEDADFDRSSDAAPEGSDGTLGAEVDAAGLPRDPNAAQSDTAQFRLAFEAVQCRHNMADENGGQPGGKTTILADPSTSGGASTHTVEVAVDSEDDGESLTSVEVGYNPEVTTGDPPADISNVGQGDLTVALNGTDITADVDGVSGSTNGATLTVTLDGSTTLAAGDTLTLTYTNVQNPPNAGSYPTDVTVNGDGGFVPGLTITGSSPA
jgi:hypothetical protein